MKTDPAVSSAVSFTLILCILILIAGVFAAVFLPAELERDAEETREHAQKSLTETLFLLRESAASADTRGLSFSTLLSKGTVTQEARGYLVINEVYQIPLTSIALEAGGTVQGISSGIWRRDGDSAAWTLFPKTAYGAGTLSLELFVSSGAVSYGSSVGIPFRFTCTGYRTEIFESPVTLTVVSDEEWACSLWEDFFIETGFLYPALEAEVTRSGDWVTAEYSAGQFKVRTVFFETAAGEIT